MDKQRGVDKNMDKEQKYKKIGLNMISLYFIGIEIENYKENINFLEKQSIYFSVPKQYSTDFITVVTDNHDDEESLKTEDGIIKIGKESVKKLINSYMALYDDEIEEDISEFYKLYVKVRDEVWNLEKGKEKVNQLNQDIQKIMKGKTDWKEV